MNEPTKFLRHAVATVAYRAEKPLRDAPEGFDAFKAGDNARTPLEVLAHCGDLYDWALTQAKNATFWHTSQPLSWDDEIARFYKSVGVFDEYIAENPLDEKLALILLQGPVADSLTHIGQLSFLRGIVGAAVKGESYVRAEIEIGRVGREQSANRTEF